MLLRLIQVNFIITVISCYIVEVSLAFTTLEGKSFSVKSSIKANFLNDDNVNDDRFILVAKLHEEYSAGQKRAKIKFQVPLTKRVGSFQYEEDKKVSILLENDNNCSRSNIYL